MSILNETRVETVTPFFRPSITDAEIEEVVECLRSGWLTTGPRTKEFESRFAEAVGAEHAVAVNSCTAALHLAVESLGLRAGQAVLVPTMTFAATAEVVIYQGAVPILVDCDPDTLNMDLDDARSKLRELRLGRLPVDRDLEVVGVMPVHVAGQMLETRAVAELADEYGLWVVEDAAHAFPAAIRTSPAAAWQRCGERTADVTCFSFYANKTITTGEGGMAVTDDPRLASRIRRMTLHGMSRGASNRYAESGSWDYRIEAPGYKYNLTDIAASIGLHQLERAEAMRLDRERLAHEYLDRLCHCEELQLPAVLPDRIHAWHLFPIQIRLDRLSIDRNRFVQLLRERGVYCSVHWRPLHLHPHYEDHYGWLCEHFPAATSAWESLVSLPLFPGMTAAEQDHVIATVTDVCELHSASGRPERLAVSKPR